jgi:alpha-L-fucosidase
MPLPPFSRRSFLKTSGVACGSVVASRLCARGGANVNDRGEATKANRPIARGPFEPTWQSLADGYRCPEWFRDAKFGIWAHWSAQCVPEQGDWYARQMYIEGHRHCEFHKQNYGHPSQFGFMDITNRWKAEKWQPESLIALYKRAGAKYFFALANHHDNFDTYDSKHHPWNSVKVGPKRDIVGDWAKAVREAGLRFGVTNHSSRAWQWLQPAYGYDTEGARVGVRYDAFTLTAADGRGTWWEGLDPQALYTGRNAVMPEGLSSIAEANDWHARNDRAWVGQPPPANSTYTDKWFLRCQDLVDRYYPDVLYFDDTELPLGQAGLDIAAHYYNGAIRKSGTLDVVLNAKKMYSRHRRALVEDIERGVATEIRPDPWQTDTCIGNWHYDRSVFENHRYKTVAQVVHMLIDVVSKNGNLMLNVPMRADGTLDADEIDFLASLAAWIAINGEGIYATRPWTRYGEGPSTTEAPQPGQFGGASDVRRTPYTSDDVRFTRSNEALYAFVLAWPENGKITLRSLALEAAASTTVRNVELLGVGPVRFSRGSGGLEVQLPEKRPCDHAFGLKISGHNLA